MVISISISDTDFDPSYVMSDVSNYATRIAARGIVVDGGNIALLNVSNLAFYKLPGGGVEDGETPEIAFEREIMEEVGCNCEIRSTLGEIIEFRDSFKLKQTSHIFVSDLVGEVGSNHLEPDELAEGFEVMWVTPIDAIKLLLSSTPTDYEGKFIIKRDLAIVNHYLSQSK
jgi:8-oxo-dGTP pyrophosphatase MutT (NUDIX family)